MKKHRQQNAVVRPSILDSQISKTVRKVEREWRSELEKKGWEIFVSSHEIIGVLREEVQETEDSVHSKSPDRLIHMRNELMDVIVSAIHGIASIDSGKMTW